MRRALLAAVMAVCAVVLPLPATAGNRATLVVTGSRTASMILTVQRPFTLSTGDPEAGEAGPTINGNADLAGFLIADVSGRRVLAGVVTTTRLKPQHSAAYFTIGAPSVRLTAGRYLLTLIASAATEVRIPAAGLAANAVHRPTKAVPVVVKDVPLDPQIGTTTEGSTPLTIGPRTVTLYGIALRSTGSGGQGRMRITSPREGAFRGFVYRSIPLPVVDHPYDFAHLLLPGDLGPARYTVDWSAEAEGIFTAARGLALAIG